MVVASSADLSAFRFAVAPVYQMLARDPQTRSLISRIESLKRALGAPPDSGPSCTAQGVLVGKPTPLDGVYVNHDSLQEQAALEHLPPSQVSPANYGKKVSVFDRGRFAGTQENGPVCTWAYGTYKVAGDRLETRYTDGGGFGTQSFNKPGEFFAFRWSLYRDTLRVKPVPPSPPDLPGGTIGSRVTTTPSTSYLSKRCPPPTNALPGGIPSPIDGVYRGRWTQQQAAAREHIPVSQENDGNYGDFVWVFDRGLFADTQRTGSVCTWQYGRFVVRNDQVTVTYTNGGGYGTQSYNKPGERFQGPWNLYRNVLTTAFSGPLTRESATPSRNALLLSRHCPLPKQALR
jgi:hypothetical protein